MISWRKSPTKAWKQSRSRNSKVSWLLRALALLPLNLRNARERSKSLTKKFKISRVRTMSTKSSLMANSAKRICSKCSTSRTSSELSSLELNCERSLRGNLPWQQINSTRLTIRSEVLSQIFRKFLNLASKRNWKTNFKNKNRDNFRNPSTPRIRKRTICWKRKRRSSRKRRKPLRRPKIRNHSSS